MTSQTRARIETIRQREKDEMYASGGDVRFLLDQLDLLAPPHARPKRIRIAVQCNKCSKTWKVSPNSDPQCPRCNGADYEVRS